MNDNSRPGPGGFGTCYRDSVGQVVRRRAPATRGGWVACFVCMAIAASACSAKDAGSGDTHTSLESGSTPVTEPDGGVVIVGSDASDSGLATTGDAAFVTGGAGTDGPANGACTGVTNAAGTVLDFPWMPGISNVSNDVVEGATIHFHWTGTYDVLEVATFGGQTPPLSPFADAMWPTEVTSGPKTAGGTFDWNVGTYPCGYRPGLYYFVSQDDPTIGPISVSLTVPANGQDNNAHYAPVACSTLADANVYGGRYAAYATRTCTVYEVNNFQTEAHYDWVPAIFTAHQGDLVLFRWTDTHNAIQVHDVLQDTPIPGGFRSGDKSNCVGGPNYSCTNGEPAVGESLFDTTNWRPGILHISDEDAYQCPPPHTACTGMNMEVDLRFNVPSTSPIVTPGGCCAIDPTKGQACNLIDVYNDHDGAQFDYNFGVNRGDLVRMRWAGSIRIYETLAVNAQTNDAPDPNQPMPNGLAMPDAIECVPGPNMSCLGGDAATADFIVDVDKAITNGQFLTEPYNQKYFDFEAIGENTPGDTSANSGIHFYVNQDSDYATNPACP
jgi:hypothetical protein